MLTQDTLDGHVTEGQVLLALEALRAEGGELAAQLEHPLGRFADDLVRTGAGSAGQLLQAVQTLGLMTAEPLAHGQDGSLEGPGGGPNAVLPSMSDHAEAIVKGVLHATNHIEVRDGSRRSLRKIDVGAGRRLFLSL